MVIIPTLLASLARELDDSSAQHLALAFAEHAIQTCADQLSSAERDISLAYIAAARDLAEGKGTISDLGSAHHTYFSTVGRNAKLSGDVTQVAAMAVRACCQRQMEDAGIVARVKYIPGLLSVAKSAQAVVGRCAAASESGPQSGDDSTIARRTRWAEAKWQLLHLIESVQFPGEDGTPD